MSEWICGTDYFCSDRAEPIIRCRDCRYFNKDGECTNDIWSVAYGEGYPYVAGEGAGNGFCAWAEWMVKNEKTTA